MGLFSMWSFSVSVPYNHRGVQLVPLVFRAEPRQSEWAEVTSLQSAHLGACADAQGDAAGHRGREEDAVGVVMNRPDPR